MCKLFSVKEFSRTSLPRILKFGTNIEYDLLYCARENQHPHVHHSLYLYIFLSLHSHASDGCVNFAHCLPIFLKEDIKKEKAV